MRCMLSTWLQDPDDAFVRHDLFRRLKPDLLIKLGTDTGGSAIFLSSFMKVCNPQSLMFRLGPQRVRQKEESCN